jgi:hypothetical protein
MSLRDLCPQQFSAGFGSLRIVQLGLEVVAAGKKCRVMSADCYHRVGLIPHLD